MPSPSNAPPAGDVVVVAPNGERGDLGVGGGVAVVEHREDQDLLRQGGAGPVPGQERDRGRQAAAGTVTHDRQPDRIDAQLAGVLAQPSQTGVGVLDRGWVRVLGGEPVVH
jgi:hypothetical protein